MTNTKQELINYVDGCIDNDIPINVFTYTMYRISCTPFIVNSIKNTIVRVNYFFKK